MVKDQDSPAAAPDDRRGGGEAQTSSVPSATLTAFAHELRNALGPVRTAAYLLRANASGDAQAQWALDLIDRQVLAITASIDELADLGRLARGTLELRLEPIEYRDVLVGAASACAPMLAEKRHTLEWKPPAAPIAVSGDLPRLTHAVSAVLRTAARGSASGCRIRIGVERTAGHCTTTIEVAAKGASPRSVATQPDEQPPESDEPVTAPINVSWLLAQAIVAGHGGALAALDASRFTMRLPLAAERTRTR